MLQDSHRIDVSLEPLDEYLVIQPIERRDRDARRPDPPRLGGGRRRRAAPGIVTAIGADVTGVEPGDKVLYPREAGFEVRLGGIEVKVVKRDELIARVHD